MEATTKAALITAFAVVTLLLLLFGGGLATGTMMTGGLMGVGSMGGVSGIWLPTLLLVALSAVLGYAIFGRK